MPEKRRVIVLAAHSRMESYLIQKLQAVADVKAIVWEDCPAIAKCSQFWRRSKKLGWMYPLGRVTLAIYGKYSEKKKREKCNELQEMQAISIMDASIPQITVSSINNEEVMDLLRETEHDLVVVTGTSIIKQSVLNEGVCFVNIHAGITPEYRGAHGAFWAVMNDDAENAGTTLHFVDKGIDTGGVIAQKSISVVANDTLDTLAAKQGYVGIELLVDFIQNTSLPYKSAPTIERDKSKSRLWYSPTLRQYFPFKRKISQIGEQKGDRRAY